ncbi:MAG: membrane dipeptidase [Polyangiaceae bacterium]|nr:membrane dipeptidase [Polyangiaceae bacterium]
MLRSNSTRSAGRTLGVLLFSALGCTPVSIPPSVPTFVPPSSQLGVATHPRWTFDLPLANRVLPSGWVFEPADGKQSDSSSRGSSFTICSCALHTPKALCKRDVRTVGALAPDQECVKDTDPGIGGMYSTVAFANEPQGCCWITTGPPDRQGSLLSPVFRPFAEFVTILAVHNNGSSVKTGEVEMLVEPERESSEHGTPTPPLVSSMEEVKSEAASRITWRVPLELQRARMRLRIVDRDETASLQVQGLMATDKCKLPDNGIPTCKESDLLPAPVWGWADLHAHFVAQIGFASGIFHGNVHSSISAEGIAGIPQKSTPSKALGECGDFHGRNGEKTLLVPPDWNHTRRGSPDYTGWPRFDVVLEQQTYIDWIRRAYEGGLRVVNVDVLNSKPINQLMFEHEAMKMVRSSTGKGVETTTDSDAWNIDRQVRAVKNLVSLPDVSNWAAVATTPKEAREIIRNNRLAIVLGAEVDDLGDLTDRLAELRYEAQMREEIRRYVRRIQQLGIRHVFPIHLVNNGFGGAAIYDGLFAGATAFMRNEHFGLIDGSSSKIFYRLDQDQDRTLAALVAPVADWRNLYRKTSETEKGWVGHQNSVGLTAAGWVLMEELARAGMVIDLDHMSDRAVEQSLCFGETVGYPMMASHTAFRDLEFVPQYPFADKKARNLETANPKHFASERSRTADQVRRIRDLGGIVGVGTGMAVRTASRWKPKFNDPSLLKTLTDEACDGSSKTFALGYLYAVDAMEGRGVALGTDANGFAPQMAPRFGPFACVGALSRDRGEEMDKEFRRNQIFVQKSWVQYQKECESTYPLKADALNSNAPTIKCPLPRPPGRFENVGQRKWENEVLLWQALWMKETGEAAALWLNKDAVGSLSFCGQTDGKKAWEIENEDLTPPNLAAGLALVNKSFDSVCAYDPQANCRARLAHAAASPGVDCTSACAANECQAAQACIGVCARWKQVFSPWLQSDKNTNPPLKKSVLEKADFDFNVDGLAHYGLLPDMLQDLRNIGLTAEHLAPLFRSAEDYIRAWEMAEERSRSMNTDSDGLGRLTALALTDTHWKACGRSDTWTEANQNR